MLHPPDNVKSMNFFTENMAFPIVIYATSEWEEQQMKYLKTTRHTTETLCKWCLSHNVHYQIMYPLHWSDVLRKPTKYLDYRLLKRRLQQTKIIKKM